MHALAEVAKVDQKAIPQILDALGDSRTAGASQRIVNEVNKLAKAAQTAANQANDKANTAQSRADSAYNLGNTANSNANTRLEKSKNLSDLTNTTTARNNLGLGTSVTMNATSSLSDRADQVATIKVVNDVNRDAATAQKTANNAHALAQTKQDKLTFTGSGKDVMRTGAFGIGASLDMRRVYPNDVTPSNLWGKGTHFGFGNASDFGLAGSRATLILSGQWDDRTGLEGAASIIAINKYISFRYQNSVNDEWSERQILLTDKENQQIGVSQEWINVGDQRSLETNYTNNTSKPIFILVTGNDSSLSLYVNDKKIVTGGKASNCIAAIIQKGERYKIIATGLRQIEGWGELR